MFRYSVFAVLSTLVVFMGDVGPAVAQDPIIPAYIGSQECTDCHTEESKAWAGSHHALAWTRAEARNILGDFDGATFSHNGVTTVFSRDGKGFFIESDGPDGELTRWPVAGVVGIAPLQQYLVETAPGTLQSFDVTWDTEKGEWYHLYPEQDLKAGDGLHWTGPYKTWNARCAECHATGYEKDFDLTSGTYSSREAEIGVGCEACHGPGEAHRDWAEDKTGFSRSNWLGINVLGLLVDLKSENPEVQIQQCAGCHSRREPFSDGNPIPGTDFHDAYRLSTLRDGLYHADGQILDEVYVYGSFLQSKMYANGVRCTDCHDAHTANRVAEGNAVCTQCHSEAGNARFPSLALQDYDTPDHHFHPTGSAGSECKSCHMIERIYMGVDGRRDHSFRVPRPDLSVETGAPDACSDCHADEGPAWAAAEIASRYPEATHRRPHFSQVMAPARRDPVAHLGGLMDIADHRDLPAIVRASALELLAEVATPGAARRMALHLEDTDPLVRAAAASVQRAAQPQERLSRLAPLLSDPLASVRIAAAREFLSLPIARLPGDMNDALQAAMGEWQSSMRAKSDFPETQLVMGGIGLTTRNFDNALRAFDEAVEMDPNLVQAWFMGVRIRAALGDMDAARAHLERALAVNPGVQALLELQSQIP